MKREWVKRLVSCQKKTRLLFLITIIMVSVQLIPMDYARGERTHVPEKEWRILHVMSYHSPWKWTDDQFNGFRAALRGLDIKYKVFQMDTKRKSTEIWKQTIGKKARDLIDAWKPDLVYTNDDIAQEYVAAMSSFV